MAAMLKLCPKEIQEMVELRWDEVGEKYETLKDRVIGWATTRTEKKRGSSAHGFGCGGRGGGRRRKLVGGRSSSVPNDEVLLLPRVRTYGEGMPEERQRKGRQRERKGK